MKHAAAQQSSDDDAGNDQEQAEEDDEESYRHHQELIPPFLPDQKVFTCYIEQPNSPKRPTATDDEQQKKGDPPKTTKFFEAVVRQVRHHPNMTGSTGSGSGDSSWSFLIHFKGWNARYDRWITASQLLPDTPEHRQRYEEQQQEEETQRQAEKEAKEKEQLRKQQRKKEQQLAKAAASTAAAANAAEEEDLSVSLPFTLKTIMVEEWEKINRRGYDTPFGYDKEMTTEAQQQKGNGNTDTIVKSKGPPRSVHALPAAVTIRQLLKHFEKKTRKKWQQKQQPKPAVEGEESSEKNINDIAQQQEANNNAMKQEIRQFCKQLGRVFETALPVCLLYPQERPQYEYYIERPKQKQKRQQSQDDNDTSVSVVSPLDIYGCEFLLRLLIRLPKLLSPGKTASPPLLADLVVLLQQNRPACFKGKYRPPTYPQEWLDWEKQYYGNPNAEAKTKATLGSTNKQVDAGAKEKDANEGSSDEDLFS